GPCDLGERGPPGGGPFFFGYRRISTTTTSCHFPSSWPCRSWTPTSRKPSDFKSVRLGTFCTKTLEVSLLKPADFARRSNSCKAERPAPRRLASRAVYTEKSAMCA